MSSARRSLFLVLVLAAPVLIWAADPPPAAKPTREQIVRWVRQLGDNEFAAREEASEKLWGAGQAAEEPLQEALKSEDREVVRRARELLDKFRWGIYPDTPRAVVELINDYRAAGANEKGTVVRKLFEAGAPGCRALAKIAAAETPEGRRVVFGHVASELREALPTLLAQNNLAHLEVLLDLGLAADLRGSVHNYAAYWLLRGKLDERIALFKAKADRGDRPATEVLAYLYRARGNLPAAIAAAEKAERADLVEALLYEAADWKALARRAEVAGTSNMIEKLGTRAAWLRLAGDHKGFDEAIAELCKYAAGLAAPRPERVSCAHALLLNGRPTEALQLLAQGNDPVTEYEILAARLQFKDAAAVVERVRKAGGGELKALEILEARTLYGLGEKDKALATFDRYAGQIKDGAAESWCEALVDAEYRVGLKDRAFEHAGRVLAATKPGDNMAWSVRMLVKLFPGDEQTVLAAALWAGLWHARPEQAPAETLKQVRALLTGRTPPKELTALLDALEPGLKDLEATYGEQCYRALAEAARASGLGDRADALLEKAGSAEALLRLGDLRAAKKDWERAAQTYQRAWEKNRSQPLPLYLSGWALEKLGRTAEAKKRIEQAHWLPLGDDAVRSGLVRALEKRGLNAAARRENDLLLRVGEPGGFYAGEALRRNALRAQARKEYARAAEGHEQAMLRCLKPYIHFVQTSAYVGVPSFVQRLRAAGLLQAGQVEEALRHAAIAQSLMPGGVDLPILLVPGLEQRGRRKEAAALFDRALGEYERVCREYPGCPWAHNSVAWLSACCRRNLDGALKHALRAIELAPNSPGYLDTLSEVYFQLGQKEKAIATEKKVVALDPKKTYFRKQLERLQAGDPKAPLPSEEDE